MGSKKRESNVLGSVVILIALVVLAFAVSGVIIASNFGEGGTPSAGGDNSVVSGTETVSNTSSEVSVSSVPSTVSVDSAVSSEESSVTASSSKNQTSSVVSRIPSDERDPDGSICYLTFDDGPSAKTTTKILDTLKENNVKATFFIKGTADLSLLQRMKDEGHTIGLHTDTHEYGKIYKSTDAYFKDLQAVSDKVYERVGIRSTIIRFPGGSSNTASRKYCKGIMSELTEMVQDRGYKYFDWNVDSDDAGKARTSEEVVSNIKKYAIKNGSTKGDICILMHDIKSYTAEALPEVIAELKAAGYEFKGLEHTSPGFHQRVNN